MPKGSVDNRWMRESISRQHCSEGALRSHQATGAAVQRQLQWSLRFRKGGTLPRVCQGKVGFGLLGNVPLNTITEHPAHWDCRAAKENPSKEESEELVKTRFFGARKVLD